MWPMPNRRRRRRWCCSGFTVYGRVASGARPLSLFCLALLLVCVGGEDEDHSWRTKEEVFLGGGLAYGYTQDWCTLSQKHVLGSMLFREGLLSGKIKKKKKTYEIVSHTHTPTHESGTALP